MRKKSKDKKHHIVYKTTNTLNGVYYIGVHSTNDLEDGYLGSGLILLKAIKKHGKDQFSKEILKHFKKREEAYQYEASLVTEELIKSRVCYNRAVGGQGGYLGEEAIAKMSKSKLGSIPWNKGNRELKYCSNCKKSLPIGSNSKNKCVKCYTKIGKENPSWKNTYIINNLEYYSLKEASKSTGIPKTTLYRYCKNPKKTDFIIKVQD